MILILLDALELVELSRRIFVGSSQRDAVPREVERQHDGHGLSSGERAVIAQVLRPQWRSDVGDAEGRVVVLNVVTLHPAVAVCLHQVTVCRRVVLVVEDHGVAIDLQEAVVGRRVAEVGEVSGGGC